MSETNQLVVIEKAKSREVFQTPGAIQAIIDEVRTKALLDAPDISTAKGRQEIKSAAFKVAQTKTYIDKVGKEITDELKALPKIVDENRRVAREQLDQLKEEIRKPLTEWEAEQERIEAEKKAKAERESAERAVLEAKLAQERAEREKAEAEARAVLEKQEAEARAKAELEAQEKRLREEQEAKERAEAYAKAKREAEEAKAAEDKRHRAMVNSTIVSSLHGECGISIDLAKKIVIAAAKGKLGKLIIDYKVAV